MHRLLQRQLKKTLGLGSDGDLEAFLARLRGYAEAAPDMPELDRLVTGLHNLLQRVENSYEQHGRDLALRNRSLQLSSEELTAVNDRLRSEAAEQAAAIEELRGTSNGVLLQLGRKPIPEGTANLQRLSGLLAELVRENETARRALQQQKDALDEHAIVSITDPEGKILYANRRFESISGYSQDELLGQDHRIVNSGFHPAAFFADMWDTIQAGRVWHGEICNRSRGGEYYWVAATIVPMLDESGTPLQYIAIRTDITAQKNLEATLEQGQRFLTGVTDAMGEGVYALDREGNCVFLNPEAERLLGWTMRELATRNFHDTVHCHEAGAVRANDCALSASVRQGETYRSEKEIFVLRDGRHLPVSVVALPLRENGQITGQVGVFQDISERLRAERSLRESREQLQVALDAARTGLWDWNPQTDEAYYSDQWLDMLGYTREEFPATGRGFFEAVHPDDMKAVSVLLEDHLQGHSPVYQAEFRMRHKNGHWVWLQAIGRVTDNDDQGRPTRATGIHQDISERREINDLLRDAMLDAEAASLAKSEFLANMSHEIRTPMNAIIGMSHLALETDLDDRQRHYVRNVNRSAEALLGIINDILDFSKIEAGKLEIESTEFRLVDVLDDVRELVGHKAAEKGLEFGIGLSTELPEMFVGDPTRLRQVLVNLGANAVKFTEQGEINIVAMVESAHDKDIRLRFEVSDTGVGIAQEHLGHLFDSFSQADSSTTRRYGGSGLGLAICKQLTEMMNGSIWVKSTPGQGSVFSFTVRLDLPEGGGASEAGEGKTALTAWTVDDVALAMRGSRILLAEDNEMNQALAVALLERIGVTVDVADDGEQAIGMLDEGVYDLVLMDCQMPRMDGYEATRRIRAHPRWRDLPVVAVTANALVGDATRAYEAGMDAHLAKPIDVGELYATLVRFVKHRDVSVAVAGTGPRAVRPGPSGGATPIDTVDGLNRVGGDSRIYARLLRKFAAGQADVVRDIRQALDDSDRAGAKLLAHTLKGTAANIGARELARLAAQVEASLPEAGEGAPDLAPVADELDAVIVQIAGFTPGRDGEEATGSQRGAAVVGDDELAAILGALREQLEECSVDSLETLDRLLVMTSDTPFAPRLSALIEPIERYDFEEATRRLDDLLDTVDQAVADAAGP